VFGRNYATFRENAKGKPTTILVEEPSDYQTVLRDIKKNAYGPKSIVVFDRSPNPDLILPRLDDNINEVHFLFNVPRSLEEARLVHDDLADGVLSRYMQRFNSVAQTFTELGGKRITREGSSNAGDWTAEYISKVPKSDLVIIASHVEEVEE